MSHRTIITAAAASIALAGATGAAVAQDTATEVKVSGLQTLTAGDTSPFDAPGVKAIRAGKAIPKGYSLHGQQVEITRGTRLAGAALRFQCPGATRLRTFGATGDAGVQATRSYVGRKATWVMSTPNPRTQTSSGAIYAVCR